MHTLFKHEHLTHLLHGFFVGKRKSERQECNDLIELGADQI